jgi:dienelactone hydrolase
MSEEQRNRMRTVRIEKYYSSLERLETLYDRLARRLALRAGNREEFLAWREAARAKVRELLGLERMETCPLQPEMLSTEATAEGRREKWIIQTEPGVWMPFYVLVPVVPRGAWPAPIVLAPHGHDGGGKLAVAGRDDIPAVRDAIGRLSYDYGRKLCADGYVVLCPDARGFGERREFYFGGKTDEDVLDEKFFLDSSCFILNRKATALGLTLAGMWTWDLMRLLDYAATRADCDAARIASVGLSGGGLQTLWLAALDERVRCAVVSGNFFGFKDSLIHQTRCACSYVPHLCEWLDAGDIGALVAPRPLLLEAGTEDRLAGPRGLENFVGQVDIARQAYAALEAESRLVSHVFEGPHRWDGGKTPGFVQQWL